MTIRNALTLVWVIVALSGCTTIEPLTKQEKYPLMYQQNPKAILVVPAVNRTTAADAPELYSTTIAKPLSEAGYYVMPIPLVAMLLQLEGVTDGAQLQNAQADKFKTLFGADAVLFVTITHWNTDYYIAGGAVSVGADFKLISTSTNQALWQFHHVIEVDTSSESKDLLVQLISTALSTATTDYLPLARDVNDAVISTLPKGPYHPRYQQDGQDAVTTRNKSREQNEGINIQF